jgi:hypothetical protein
VAFVGQMQSMDFSRGDFYAFSKLFTYWTSSFTSFEVRIPSDLGDTNPESFLHNMLANI